MTVGATTGGSVPAATQSSLAAALTTTLHDSTGTGSGSIDWNFNIADNKLDFLAGGETRTFNYNIKVSDATTSSMQAVSVTVTGANDAVAVTSGPESGSVSERPGLNGSSLLDSTSPVPTGTLNFSDVDLSDTHAVGVAVSSATWSAGSDVPFSTQADLLAAFMTTLHDSTVTGSGGVDWSFSIQDKDLDFLGAGETLTVVYDVTVSDGSTSSTQQVTVTATGAADPLVVNPVTAGVSDTVNADTGNFIGFGNVIFDAGDTGGDAGVSLTVHDVNGSAANIGSFVSGAYGNLKVFSDGTYLYQANANVDPLQVGQNVTDVFSFTIIDSLGRTQATTITFNVAGADDAPVITAADAFASLREDAGPTVGVNGSFETGDLTGWFASSGVSTNFVGIGGEYGNYAARLSGSGFLEQDVATTAGQHYTLSFSVAGDSEASATSFDAYWDGALILSQANVALGFHTYTFDVVGDTFDPTTQLFFDFSGDGSGQLVDRVSITPTPGPATESSSGSIAFSDIETADTNTASFMPQASGYVGTFSLDPVSESGGSGSLAWHYSVANANIQCLAQGQTLVQTYSVLITDSHGAATVQDVVIAIDGANDAPTAVNDTIITDVGPNNAVIIAPWALAANDTDPDTTDHVFVNGIGTSTGGNAGGIFGAVFFNDDATLGGSFTYNAGDGIATSSNFATATVINSATSTTTLTGTGANEIIIANNGGEALNGGGGNDILFGYTGSHVLTGGTGNDTFAFQQQPTGTNVITDFNSTTEHDHIAISANSFGGGLTAGQDVSSTFETSADNQFSGFAEFHFNTANQTLYFSSDGSQASAITVVQLQAGVTLNPHDLLIV